MSPTPILGQAAGDYARIERAIRYLTAAGPMESHEPAGPRLAAAPAPSLTDLAHHLKLSPFHLQRLFTRWAGVSPKRFQQSLTVATAKNLLARSQSVLQTTYAVGLSSPGRLHDLFVALEAMTPGDYKSGGATLTVRYGYGATPYGRALICRTDRGISALDFLPAGGTPAERAAAADDLLTARRAEFPAAQWTHDPYGTERLLERIFVRRQASLPPIQVCVRGTNFQIQVWRALLRIPEGAAVSYSDLAEYLHHPTATRAVANAIAHNPVAWLIPCHRVLRSSGALGGYRWGTDRKQALLARESARATPAAAAASPDAAAAAAWAPLPQQT